MTSGRWVALMSRPTKLRADEATIAENILDGQYSHPLRVIAFNTIEGWADDVTEDIAIAVLSPAPDTSNTA